MAKRTSLARVLSGEGSLGVIVGLGLLAYLFFWPKKQWVWNPVTSKYERK